MKATYPRIAALTVFCIIIMLFCGLEFLERLRFRASLQTSTINRLSQIRGRLEAEINANFYLTRGLIAYVATDPDISAATFQRISSELLRHRNYIRNIALAPQNVIRFVFPLAGNEKALGFDYRSNKEQWPAVAEAIESRRTVTAGPVTLVQGGQGFISRTPIFIKDDRSGSGEYYWGLASIVIEKELLFRVAGLFDRDLGIDIALRGKDGRGARGEMIEGYPSLFANQPVLLPVLLPDGEWQLAAVPSGGWDSPSPYLPPLRLLGLFLASLIGWGTFVWLRRQKNIHISLEAAWLDAQKAQSSLRQNEDFLNTVIDNIPAMIFVKDAEHLRFIRFNRTGASMLGFSDTDFLGKTDFDLFPEEEARFFTSKDREVFAGRRLVDIPEEPIHTRSGERKVLHTKKIPVFDQQGQPLYLVGISEDITEQLRNRQEREKLERQLLQAQKLETIGKMAGGVAHDLNNILSGIINYPELLLLKLPPDSPLRKPLTDIQDSGIRAASVVADLLTIARGVAASKEHHAVNSLVAEYLASPEHRKLLQNHPQLDCSTELAPDAGHIFCSPVHIKKSLMNLVSNAAESITAGNEGRILITTGRTFLEEPLPGFPDISPGEFVVLAVVDNGSGISDKDREHIFEPFYTRKHMGISGTGLGLTVVWNTVTDHRGGLTVTSDGRGTVFTLYFPASREQQPAATVATGSGHLHGSGQEILVVDDEPHQRDIASAILRELGYRPLAVSSGEEAVEILKTRPFDLVVLDMIMEPGMNGRQTFEAMLAISGHQKAIIASGFADHQEMSRIEELGIAGHVKKPYTMEQLGIIVRYALA